MNGLEQWHTLVKAKAVRSRFRETARTAGCGFSGILTVAQLLSVLQQTTVYMRR
jgi:hypothetical protein